jgi:hypothetical protein
MTKRRRAFVGKPREEGMSYNPAMVRRCIEESWQATEDETACPCYFGGRCDAEADSSSSRGTQR